MERAPPYKALFHFTTIYSIPILILGLLSSVAAGAIIPIQAYLLGKVTQNLSSFGSAGGDASNTENNTLPWVTYLGYFSPCVWFINSLFFFSWALFGELQAKNAREKLFKSMLQHDIEWFEKRKDGVGSLIARIQSFTAEYQRASSQPLGMVIQSILTSALSFGLALYVSWKLTLVIIAGIPIFVPILKFCSARGTPPIALQHVENSKASKYVNNALTSIETVKCFDGQEIEHKQYRSTLRRAAAFYSRQVLWFAAQYGVTRVATIVIFVQGFWFGGYLLGKGEITTENILIAFLAAIMATASLMQVQPQLVVLLMGRIAATKLRAIQIHDSPKTRYRVQTRQHFVGDIWFHRVEFSYPNRPNQAILRNLNIEFPACNLTFVIGESGCGKSTIGQLLIRLYDYNQNGGGIVADGYNIHELDPTWLRQKILLVEQESVLFQGNIFENIACGRIDGEVSLQEIEKAAKFANILDTIRLMPDGFDTQVGSKGMSLSGGQRQRIALARAFLRDPPVLILDECTSALDYQNRGAIMEKIRSWRYGKTTIVITHDISQILARDMIYIVKDGQVVDHGKRFYLEAKPNSAFRQFWHSNVGSSTNPNLNNPLPPLPDSPLDEDVPPSPSGISLPGGLDEDFDDPLLDYLQRFCDEDTQRYSIVSPTLQGRSSTMPFRQSMLPGPRLSIIAGPSTFRELNRSSSQSPTSGIGRRVPSPIQVDLDGFNPERPAPALLTVPSEVVGRSARVRQDLTLAVQSPHGSMTESILQRTIQEIGGDAIPLQSLSNPMQGNINKVVEVEQPKKEKTLSIWRILSTVWPSFTWKLRRQLLFAVLGATGYAVATPMFGFVFSKLLANLYQPAGRSAKVTILSLIVLAIAFADGICVFVQQSCFERCALAWVNLMRSKAYRRVLLQPREFFDREENGVSRLMDHFDADAEQMQALLGRFIGYLFIASAMVIICITWSLTSCWKLTLVLVACTPIIIGVSVVLTRVNNVHERRIANRCEHAASIFMECFTNIKTVRTLSVENKIEKKYMAASSEIFISGLKKALYCGLLYGASQAIVIAVISLTFYFALELLVYGDYTLRPVLEVLSILLWTVPNAANIFAFIPRGSASQEAATRLLRLVNLPLNSFELNGKTRIDEIKAIKFSNVNFAYPTRPTKLVLRNLTLSIGMGECVAIVGSSGSGKSTIASLLLKLYPIRQFDSSFGSIYLNGRDINTIHTSTLRNLITIVPQTPTIFSATVRENIIYGLPASSNLAQPDSVRRAAKSAGIEEFILSLPHGYDTLIGEGGLGVSGGQAQRIAIARALVRKPHILILDEATSALDVESANKIRETVISLLDENRKLSTEFLDIPLDSSAQPPSLLTVIIITHNKEMMNFADKVAMLHEGRIVEEGSYGELIRKRNGPFSKMMRGEDFAKETQSVNRRSWTAMNNSPGIISSPWMNQPSGSLRPYTGKGKQAVRDV